MITIKDIAREVGVSHPTVSLVLNEKAKQARISDGMCLKIREAAKRLGYTRNEIARSMVTGKSEVIAFAAADMGLIEYVGQIQSGILAEVSIHNYSLKLYRIDADNQAETARALIEQRVSGVIIHSPRHLSSALLRKELAHFGVPTVLVNLSNDGKSSLGITTDDYQAAFEAVTYLVFELRHRNVAHVTYVSDDEYIANRLKGYLDCMKKFKAKSQVLNIPEFKNEDKEFLWFKTFVKNISAQNISAVFCAEDVIAMKILRAAYALNIRIPENLSVVGFGNMDMGRFSPVPLTTISQPFSEMGRLAADNIIETASRKNISKKGTLKLKAKLVVRDSAIPADRRRIYN